MRPHLRGLLTLALRNRNASKLSARPALPECGAAKRQDLHAHPPQRDAHVRSQCPCSHALTPTRVALLHVALLQCRVANTPTRHASKHNAHARVPHAGLSLRLSAVSAVSAVFAVPVLRSERGQRFGQSCARFSSARERKAMEEIIMELSVCGSTGEC